MAEWDIVEEKPIGAGAVFAEPVATQTQQPAGDDPWAPVAERPITVTPAAEPPSRFRVNMREGFDSTLLGEGINRVQSGQVAGFVASDTERAIQEARAAGSPVALDRFADGKPSPYGQMPLDQVQAIADQTRAEAERRKVAFDAQRRQEQAQAANLPPISSISDALVAGLGQLTGGALSPENLVGGPGSRVVRGVGETVVSALGRRVAPGVAEGAVAGAVADPVIQSGRVQRGEQKQFEPGQLGESVLVGGAAGGLFRLAGAGWDALRGVIAKRRGVDPVTITPDNVSPDDAASALADPEFAAFAKANGIDLNALASDPRVQVLRDRLTARREAEAMRPEPGSLPGASETARIIGRENDRRLAEATGVADGTIDPAATNLKPRDQITDPILVDQQGGAFVADQGALQGRPAAERLQAQDRGRVADAFTLADRQRGRAGPEVRDTQTAGRPAGLDDADVVTVDGATQQPVRVIQTGEKQSIVEPYDPRTGEVTGERYQANNKGLTEVRYARDPRMAQDFVERARGPKPPELPREARGRVTREPNQTYRAGMQPEARTGGGPSPEPPRQPDLLAPEIRENPAPQTEIARLPAPERAPPQPSTVFEDRIAAAPTGHHFNGVQRQRETALLHAFEEDGGAGEVRRIVQEHDIPDMDMPAIAGHYRRHRKAGLEPREAAERAVDDWVADEERASVRIYDAVSSEVHNLPDDAFDSPSHVGGGPDTDRYLKGRLRGGSFVARTTPSPMEREAAVARRDAEGLDEAFAERADGGRSEDSTGEAPASRGEGGSRREDGPGERRGASEAGAGDEVRSPMGRPREDDGPDGGKQTVIPGAERISEREQAERGMSAPLRGGDKTPPAGGLFDEDARNQSDLFDGSRLSANPLFDPQAWAKVLGMTERRRQETLQFFEHFKEMREAMDSGKKTPLWRHGGILGDLGRWAFHTIDGQMRALETHYKSKAIGEVADMLHAPADMGRGRTVSRTYSEAVQSRSQGNLNELSRVLEPFLNDKGVLDQIERLVKNPKSIRRGTPIHDAAARVRKLLDDEDKYLRDAGVQMGKVPDYYPRIVNPHRVVANQAGFKAAAKAQYLRDKIAKNATEAEKMADEWLSSIVLGHAGAKADGTDFVLLGGTPSADFRKERIFSDSIEKDPNNPLNRFYTQGMADTLTLHFQRTARRAEWSRRFGDDLKKWKELKQKIIDEGNAKALPDVVDLIATATGVTRAHLPKPVANTIAAVRTLSALSLLPHATITSLSETAMPAIRAGAPQRILGDIVRTVGAWTKMGMKEETGIAEDLGLVRRAIGDSILGARYHSLEPGSKMNQDLVNRFFRSTGLEQFTAATRAVAIQAGQVFLRRLALDVANGGKRQNSSRALLRELGISDTDAFAQWLAGKGGKLGRHDLRAGDDMTEAYKTALLRFNEQTVLSPDPTVRPKWASHPTGSLLFMLQSYAYAFQKNVLNRAAKGVLSGVVGQGYNTADRLTLMAPAMMLPLLAAIQWGLDEPRRAVLGTSAKDKEDTAEKKFMRAISRGGLTGILDPYINMVTGARYDRDFATMMLGPGLGRLAGAVDAILAGGVQNSPNTNTAERNLAKQAYNISVAPLLAAIASLAPVHPVYRAGVVYGGSSGTAREAFTEAVAGPKGGGGRPSRPERPSRPSRPGRQ